MLLNKRPDRTQIRIFLKFSTMELQQEQRKKLKMKLTCSKIFASNTATGISTNSITCQVMKVRISAPKCKMKLLTTKGKYNKKPNSALT